MREFLRKPLGKVIAAVLVLAGVLAGAYSIFSMAGAGAAAQYSRQTYIDARTGQTFEHTLVAGEVVPVMAPSGERSGYPPELCYWTAEGTAKRTPDYVLLREAAGLSGPTFCPVCHRLVVHHNPTPASGARVPPTQAEYEMLHSVTAGAQPG